jgi:uncharacterized protein YgiB involved in biofilm formation
VSTRTNFLAKVAVGVAAIALLSGCDDKPKEQAIKTYESVEKCRADIADDATAEERVKVTEDCKKAFDHSTVEYERTVTRYQSADQCSTMYSNCRPASDGNGYVPLMAGFMLGYMAGGSPVYHPYYYDRWHTAYVGGAPVGHFNSGYVVAPQGSSITRNYTSVTINKGSPPPPAASTRGMFGGTQSAFASRGITVSNPVSPSGRSPSAIAPSSGSARGVFGSSAASASSSSSG